MTLPPLSDHHSDLTRQHDVSANLHAYGTEGASNENTLQYDTKNPFSTGAMNRSVQGNCTDEARSSSLQSKGIDTLTTNGAEGGRSVDRYRDRPTMKAFHEPIIKESSLNTNELERKQRRDSSELGLGPDSYKTRKGESPKSETNSSHGDDDLLNRKRNLKSRKRGSTRKISDDDENLPSISEKDIKLTRLHSHKPSTRDKQQDRHLHSDKDHKPLDHLGAHSEKIADASETQKNSQHYDRHHKRAPLANESANERDSEPDQKYVRQTRSGRQSKKPPNFDQYSAASQTQDNRKDVDYEEEKEEYFGSCRA